MKTWLMAVLMAAPVSAYCESNTGAYVELGQLAENGGNLPEISESVKAQAASEIRLQDAMKVIKKSFWESRSAFHKRAAAEIKSVLLDIFPPREDSRVPADTYKVELDDYLCGPEQASSYPGLSGYADWEREGWKYTVEFYACSRDPLYIKYVSISPADGDEVKMPKTREEFIQLVNRLAYVRIADARETTDHKGRRIFVTDLSMDGKSRAKVDYLGLLDDSEKTGAIFFGELKFANLGFFTHFSR